jgi:hypothetical protein
MAHNNLFTSRSKYGWNIQDAAPVQQHDELFNAFDHSQPESSPSNESRGTMLPTAVASPYAFLPGTTHGQMHGIHKPALEPGSLEQDLALDTRIQLASNSSTRSKYAHLNWDKYQAELRRLYMDENKSLPETMKIMKESHSFDAS